MANLVIVTIHGMGETEVTYADELRHRLQSMLSEEWQQIAFQSVYYQGLQDNQRRVFEQVERNLSYKELRKFLLFGFSDAASLESSRSEPNGVYVQAQLQILATLRRAYADLGGQPKAVVIVAQSLGGQGLSNYIWDAQHPGRWGIWRDIDQYVTTDAAELSFLRMDTLHRLFTTGCNIPIFVAGHDPIVPIAPPNPQFRWFNFYDANDVLGWPLQPLSEAYDRLVEDIPCNVGSGIQGFLTRWTPLSHGQYWDDRGFLEALVIEIRKSLSSAL
jgi:hypothetical protein